MDKDSLNACEIVLYCKAQEVTSNKPSTSITLRVTTVLLGNERMYSSTTIWLNQVLSDTTNQGIYIHILSDFSRALRLDYICLDWFHIVCMCDIMIYIIYYILHLGQFLQIGQAWTQLSIVSLFEVEQLFEVSFSEITIVALPLECGVCSV